MSELEDKIEKLIDAFRENMPSKESDRFMAGDTDVIANNTSLTVTFTLSKLWVTRLIKAYADSRSGCTYTWNIDGKSYNLNELEFYKGKPLVGEEIVLVIANTSGSTQTVGYFVSGWGDRVGGV